MSAVTQTACVASTAARLSPPARSDRRRERNAFACGVAQDLRSAPASPRARGAAGHSVSYRRTCRRALEHRCCCVEIRGAARHWQRRQPAKCRFAAATPQRQSARSTRRSAARSRRGRIGFTFVLRSPDLGRQSHSRRRSFRPCRLGASIMSEPYRQPQPVFVRTTIPRSHDSTDGPGRSGSRRAAYEAGPVKQHRPGGIGVVGSTPLTPASGVRSFDRSRLAGEELHDVGVRDPQPDRPRRRPSRGDGERGPRRAGSGEDIRPAGLERIRPFDVAARDSFPIVPRPVLRPSRAAMRGSGSGWTIHGESMRRRIAPPGPTCAALCGPYEEIGPLGLVKSDRRAGRPSFRLLEPGVAAALVVTPRTRSGSVIGASSGSPAKRNCATTRPSRAMRQAGRRVEQLDGVAVDEADARRRGRGSTRPNRTQYVARPPEMSSHAPVEKLISSLASHTRALQTSGGSPTRESGMPRRLHVVAVSCGAGRAIGVLITGFFCDAVARMPERATSGDRLRDRASPPPRPSTKSTQRPSGCLPAGDRRGR